MSVAFKNILANYGSRLWSIVAVYVFTPLYIKLLGIESYGVISFYAVVMGIVVLADVGIASAIDREFAKNDTDEHKLGVLFFFEKIYAAICLLIILIIFLFSGKIAAHWLDSRSISQNDLANFICLIGIGAASQLMTIIYGGALMGLQKQVRYVAIQTLGSIIKNVAVLGILLFFRKDLYAFLGWQVVCNILMIYAFRKCVLNYFNKDILPLKYDRKTIPTAIWRYLGGMFFISLLNALNMQTDKLITSKMFTLEHFGYYSLVSVLAQSPLLLTVPFVLSVFPYMTKTISENKKELLFPVFKRFCFLINAVVIPVVLIFILYGKSLFSFWTHGNKLEENTLEQIDTSLSLLTTGYLFVAFQQLYFYFLLAEGITKYSTRQILFQIFLIIPLLVLFIKKWDMAGAAASVLIVQFLGFLYLVFVVKKKLIKGHLFNLLFSSYFIPFSVSLLLCLIVHFVALRLERNHLFIPLAVVSGLMSLTVSFFVYNKIGNDKIDLKQLF